MNNQEETSNRELIMRAAEELFASKGFDKASIAEIAQRAGVNSALIYYYFKNKRAVLDEIIEGFVGQAKQFLVEMLGKDYRYGSPEMLEQMGRYRSFFLEHDRVLRIMMAESLKDGEGEPPLFRLIESGVSAQEEGAAIAELNRRGFGLAEDPERRRVHEFFTGIMPLVVFSLFRSPWCRHFCVPEDRLDLHFAQASEETHG